MQTVYRLYLLQIFLSISSILLHDTLKVIAQVLLVLVMRRLGWIFRGAAHQAALEAQTENEMEALVEEIRHE